MRHAAQVLKNENQQLREQMKEFIHSKTMSIIQTQAELHHSLLLKTRVLNRTQSDLDKCMKHKEEMRSEMRRLNRKLKRAQEAKQNEDLNLKFC
ncbi:CCDC92 domain-containing protein [Caenorhabditis elegans]|uniref:CCDC92 domain-containing protein n=1 Tax=Caenorhabditis elegans TaxID=6239 RepID=Q9BLC2_CAEEL|nr:CCDC92 domain-containing protein [Caenorhabditis elegans]CCD67484.1 CCDC92 domain-containing protein [Caenorhabditis elegans]|eukprot:NP_494636.2 Uncharacterized protein CELE_F12E12.6 [Caenorhabditis elegans]